MAGGGNVVDGKEPPPASPGCDWRRYLEISPARAFHTHGRGIAMSRSLSFDRLEYLGAGNQVLAIRGEHTSHPGR